MTVKEIMTKDPIVCTPQTSLREVARAMCDYNIGEIPIVDAEESMKPLGVITDRDITCRSVAAGKNPMELEAAECMTSPAVTVTPDTDLARCREILAKEQLRRLPVVDRDGRVCGIVSQADIALRCDPKEAGEVVREVSLAER